jgi:AcrR family transcriptional regulator
MKEKFARRSNRERTETTRAALVEAARALFIEKGYAETGTPEIVSRANVTRGALYHHFADKADLLRAVVAGEAHAVAEYIRRETEDIASDIAGLLSGAEAFFIAMSVPGRARLLLLEGPAELGRREMDRIDEASGRAELREGLFRVMTGSVGEEELDALAELISAAFDRAALAIADGKDIAPYRLAIRRLLSGMSNARQANQNLA